MLYQALKKLITTGYYTYDDMHNKLDLFLVGNRITEAQYTELTGLLDPEKK